MAAQAPSRITPTPQTDRREAQRQEAARQGLDAAQAAQRALGSASSVREARDQSGPAPRPNSPAHSPGERSPSQG